MAFKLMAENGGVASRAMEDAGYSKMTAVTPQKLTESKGFKELMDEHGLGDKDLASKHKKFLNSKKEEIGVKALDMAYKVKGNYAPEKTTSLNFNINASTKDLSKHQEIRDRYEEELKKALQNE